MSIFKQAAWMLVVVTAIVSTGCQSLRGDKSLGIAEKLDIPDGVPWKGDKKPKSGVPSRIVATWTNAVLQRPGQGSERGFGGRLFFYGSKDATPIPVEGQLVVYAFDESGRKPTDNKPTKRYVFPPEQFAKHEGESEFGPSYSVWLPWGEVQGPSTEVSLIARFEPVRGGSLIVSDQARSRLPGLGEQLQGVGETQLASQQLKPEIQRASHTTPAVESSSLGAVDDVTPSKRRMETTSIKLPQRGGFGGSPLQPANSWKTEVSYGGR